jgi:hypothetical protein
MGALHDGLRHDDHPTPVNRFLVFGFPLQDTRAKKMRKQQGQGTTQRLSDDDRQVQVQERCFGLRRAERHWFADFETDPQAVEL